VNNIGYAEDLISRIVACISWVFLFERRRGYVVRASPDLHVTQKHMSREFQSRGWQQRRPDVHPCLQRVTWGDEVMTGETQMLIRGTSMLDHEVIW